MPLRSEMFTQTYCISRKHYYKQWIQRMLQNSWRRVKLRYNNHTMSFRHKKHVNNTELSKYLWKLKEKNLQWKIERYTSPYKCGTRKCNLFLTAKMTSARSAPKKFSNWATSYKRCYITIKQSTIMRSRSH